MDKRLDAVEASHLRAAYIDLDEMLFRLGEDMGRRDPDSFHALIEDIHEEIELIVADSAAIRDIIEVCRRKCREG